RGRGEGGFVAPMIAPIIDRRLINSLWHGLPTVPPCPTEGLKELRETFGRPSGRVRRPDHNARVVTCCVSECGIPPHPYPSPPAKPGEGRRMTLRGRWRNLLVLNESKPGGEGRNILFPVRLFLFLVKLFTRKPGGGAVALDGPVREADAHDSSHVRVPR